MKTYVIKKVPDRNIDWNKIEKGKIDLYPWGDQYTPEAFFSLVYIQDEGFVLKMTCLEENPKAIYDNYMDPVYCDSCMEFFADYSGEKPGSESSPGYVNFELNAKGTLLSAIGRDRNNRIPILEVAGDLPQIKAYKDEKKWSVEVFTPFHLLKKMYKYTEFTSGHKFRANAYKCGDECSVPHYGMWNIIEKSTPDYHIPAFFGEFTME